MVLLHFFLYYVSHKHHIYLHMLMMLWTQGSLLNQLAIANESLGGGIVVVMAERDKEEMELDIAKMEFDFRQTSVICRSGSPLILADLKKVKQTLMCLIK